MKKFFLVILGALGISCTSPQIIVFGSPPKRESREKKSEVEPVVRRALPVDWITENTLLGHEPELERELAEERAEDINAQPPQPPQTSPTAPRPKKTWSITVVDDLRKMPGDPSQRVYYSGNGYSGHFQTPSHYRYRSYNESGGYTTTTTTKVDSWSSYRKDRERRRR